MRKKYHLKKITVFAITLLLQINFTLYAQSLSTDQLLAKHEYQGGFEENKGQIADFEGVPANDVLFRANTPNYSIFFTQKGISYVMYARKQSNLPLDVTDDLIDSLHYARVDLNLIGASIKKENMVMEDELSGFTSYYLAHCPSGLVVNKYRSIRIKNVYPGINWVFRYDGNQMHHEFEVEPNADAGLIQMKVDWADVELQDNGKKMLLNTPLGAIQDGEIYAFEATSKKEVEVYYSKSKENIISYEIKNAANREKLIIDPPLSLLWGTYFGGNNNDNLAVVKTDVSGNVFITGYIPSTNFPTLNSGGGAYFQGTYGGGSMDAIIAKFDNTGVLLWSTYFGGTGIDNGLSLTIDNLGNVFVVGSTTSNNFPILDPGNGAFFDGVYNNGDAYILKFSNSGTLLWATYVGGNFSDALYSIITDSSNNLYIAGSTGSTMNFPLLDMGGGAYYQSVNTGSNDGVIMKFSNTGVLNWSTLYGGAESDLFQSIALDASGNIFIAATVTSIDFPTFNPGNGAYFQGTNGGGLNDLAIVKFSPSGQVLWSTYYGGSATDGSNASLTTDSDGNLFVTGDAHSTDFPVFNPGNGAYFEGSLSGTSDLYLLKFDNSGERQWATYYGGSDIEYTGFPGSAISSDLTGNIFVTGISYSADFPTQNPGGGAYYVGTSTVGDVVILQFNNNGQRLWSTFGGASSRGCGITNDINGNVFVVGYTLNLILQNPGGGAYSQSFGGGGRDGFIYKFESNTGCTSPIQPSVISGSNSLCAGATQTYSVTNDPTATSYTWTLPGGWSGTSTTNSIVATAGAGSGNITVTANNACGSSTEQTLSITVNALPIVVASGTATICNGDGTTLSAAGANSYTWDNGAGSGPSVFVSPTSSTTYTVTGIDLNGCENTGDVTITVNNLPTVSTSANETICAGESVTLSASGATTYSWDNGLGAGSSHSVSPANTTTYMVTGIDGNGCENTDNVTITVNNLPTVSTSANETICAGESVTLSASGAISYSWDNGLGVGASHSVSPTNTTTYAVTGIDGNGCENTGDVTVTVNTLPTVAYTQNPTLFCENHSAIALTGGTPSGGVYSGTGVSTGNFDPGSAGIGTHTITYSFTDGNNCSNTDTQQIEVDACAGIDEQSDQLVSIYPNPFADNFTLSFNDVRDRTIELVNLQGAQIKLIEVHDQNTVISTTDLSSGTYYLKVIDENLVFKLVKN